MSREGDGSDSSGGDDGGKRGQRRRRWRRRRGNGTEGDGDSDGCDGGEGDGDGGNGNGDDGDDGDDGEGNGGREGGGDGDEGKATARASARAARAPATAATTAEARARATAVDGERATAVARAASGCCGRMKKLMRATALNAVQSTTRAARSGRAVRMSRTLSSRRERSLPEARQRISATCHPAVSVGLPFGGIWVYPCARGKRGGFAQGVRRNGGMQNEAGATTNRACQ